MVDHKRLGSKEYQNWTETRTTPDREESWYWDSIAQKRFRGEDESFPATFQKRRTSTEATGRTNRGEN